MLIPRDLRSAYPGLCDNLPRVSLTSLPTPLRTAAIAIAGRTRSVIIKEDNLSADLYGGNKVRKLEYLLARAVARGCPVVATFGAAGSHHALATALYARQQGLGTIAFLSHQVWTPQVAPTLDLHLALNTRLIPFGGSYAQRISILRNELRGQRASIIPAGGSSWRGTVPFVDAAIECAHQLATTGCTAPTRLYVATGTMGTAVGLALGFALCELPIELHAIRITPTSITDEKKMRRLARKTAYMLHRLDEAIPAELADRARITLRHEFVAGGYARTDAATERAISTARSELGLTLEGTYTAKAMAALLHDMSQPGGQSIRAMFWQTYHAGPLPAAPHPGDPAALPGAFRRYFR